MPFGIEVDDALLSPIRTYRLARTVRRYRSPALDRLSSAILESADSHAIRELWREMRPLYRQDPVSAAKYADPRFWLLLNTDRAARLDLHNTSGLRILDIGCGPAYFLAVARALGHHCEGVDAPEPYLTPVERRVYGALIEALHCRPYVTPLLIERFVPLPFGDRSYDLITAFWICFNRHCQPDEWGVEEWRFFVADAFRCLRPGGRIVLDLNENPERYGELRFYDPAMLAYFRSLGTVSGGRMILTRQAAPALQ